MKYVVTGAAGFIGSHLTEALVANGHDVVPVDSFTDYYDPALKEENAAAFDVSRLDLAEDELALDGFDGVFHLAGQPGVRSSFGEFDVYVRRNIVATQKVFECAARAGVRVVFASSSSVYGDGRQSRSFTYVADAVAATIAAMDRAAPGTLYNVGGGTEATMRDAIATLEDVSGQTLDLAMRPAAAGDVRRTAADTRHIEHDLGWRATTELGDGLRAQWEWASVRVAAP